MAMKLNAGKVSRDDVVAMNPTLLIVKNDRRGRCKPPSDEAIIRMAVSMMEHGQLQPVEARRITPSNKLEVVLGFTRTAAARLIREGFHDPDTNEFHQKPAFMIRVKPLKACNDEVAFIRNIVSNEQRNNTTPIDDAKNQQDLRALYNKTNGEIARIYGWKGTAKVLRLQKLLALDAETQDKIHSGEMAVNTAIDLLGLPNEERESILEKATTDNGKVSGTTVRAAIRERVLSDPEGVTEERPQAEADVPPATPPTKQRTVKEIKTFFEGQALAADTDPAVAKFSREFLEFLAGKRGDKAMMNALDRLLDAQRTKGE